MPPTDAEFVDTVVAANLGMIRAVHHGDRLRLIAELNLLLTAIIEHNATPGAASPDDEAVRRAVAALNRKEIAG